MSSEGSGEPFAARIGDKYQIRLTRSNIIIFRKDRNLHGGGVMLLIHKDISHMALSEQENDSESVCVKAFANKTFHYMASWYLQPGGSSEDFQVLHGQLDRIRNKHKGNKLPSVHV